MKRHLGMYVHMHWGYNHPYAARTWTLDDWRGYVGGIAALGFDTVMIWSVLETMPDLPTRSDVAHLRKIRDVIDLLHGEYGMTAILFRHMDLLEEISPQAGLYYWMWVGWESYNRFWQKAESGDGTSSISTDLSDWESVVRRLAERPEKPWGLSDCADV